MSEDLEYLNNGFERATNALIDARADLAKKHPNWAETDARLTLFNKCTSVMRSVHLGITFMIHHLVKPNWWAEKAKYDATRQAIQQSCDEFNMFLRISSIQGLFFAIESSLRLFVRAIDPTACSGGCDDFKNIYEWLLARVLSGSSDDLDDSVQGVMITASSTELRSYIPTRQNLFVSGAGRLERSPQKSRPGPYRAA